MSTSAVETIPVVCKHCGTRGHIPAPKRFLPADMPAEIKPGDRVPHALEVRQNEPCKHCGCRTLREVAS